MKQKTCKVCKAEFEPQKMGQKVCSPDCAISLAVSERGKAVKVAQVKERKADKVQREKMKSKAQWIAEAQTAFNAYVRERDRRSGYPCISSGKPLDWTGNAVDAGHYRSRGSAPHLRFDERNCHAQSKHDNRYAAGNIVGYRIGLIARIGQEAVDALESDQSTKRYTVDDLRQIKATYSEKTKQLKKDRE